MPCRKMEVKMLLLAALLAALEVVLAAGSHSNRCLPGSVNNISRNDPGLQRVVLGATYSFNNQSNDAFLFKASAIRSAQRQIVKGFRYVVEMEISRTVCRKRDNKNLTDCDFQPEGPLHQTFRCHLEVWLIPWKDQRRIIQFLCET